MKWEDKPLIGVETHKNIYFFFFLKCMLYNKHAIMCLLLCIFLLLPLLMMLLLLVVYFSVNISHSVSQFSVFFATWQGMEEKKVLFFCASWKWINFPLCLYTQTAMAAIIKNFSCYFLLYILNAKMCMNKI